MGLIKAALGSAGGVLADQWKEYFYCEALPENVMAVKGQKRTSGRSSNTKRSDNIISNGSVIAVAAPVFLPDLTVGEHFTLLSRRSGVDFAEVHELWAIDDAIRNSAVSDLSSGQRQRVYLAAQLYQPAKALLIDEPERHLDHTWTAFLAEELRHLDPDYAVGHALRGLVRVNRPDRGPRTSQYRGVQSPSPQEDKLDRWTSRDARETYNTFDGQESLR